MLTRPVITARFSAHYVCAGDARCMHTLDRANLRFPRFRISASEPLSSPPSTQSRHEPIPNSPTTLSAILHLHSFAQNHSPERKWQRTRLNSRYLPSLFSSHAFEFACHFSLAIELYHDPDAECSANSCPADHAGKTHHEGQDSVDVQAGSFGLVLFLERLEEGRVSSYVCG